MIKVLVTGCTGQLGYDVTEQLKKRGIEFLATTRNDFDLTDEASTRSFFTALRPNAVIHCAAYTAVDRAEEEKDLCYAVNATGTANIARVCKEIDAKLLYISTDYVFPGEGAKFYEPDDATGPVNVYGQTKLAGEIAARDCLEKYFIVRISWVFGQNGNNFVKTMLRVGKERGVLSVVDDQVGSPTYTADLAELLCDMIHSEKYGVYHATNEGVCSWAEFAREIFRQADLDVKVKAISSDAYPTQAKRPLNSRLNKDALEQAGFQRLPHWQDALERFVKIIS